MPASLAVQATRMRRFKAVCRKVARGYSLKAACKAARIRRSVVNKWLLEAPESAKMGVMLSRAREDQAAALVDDVIDIADIDDPKSVNARRLRVDARVKVAPLLAPRKYGKLAGIEEAAATLLVAFTGLALPQQVQAEVTGEAEEE